MKTKKTKITVASVRKQWQALVDQQDAKIKELEDEVVRLSAVVAEKESIIAKAEDIKRSIRKDLSRLLRFDSSQVVISHGIFNNEYAESTLSFPEIYARIGMLLEIRNRTNYEGFFEVVNDRLAMLERAAEDRQQ